METVFNVVKYLAVNGLPFRGRDENTDFGSESFGSGVYLNTFGDLLFKLDEIEGVVVTNVGGRGVVVRFVNEDEKIEEHAIDVVEAHDRSAQGLLELLTTCLASLCIPLDGIVSQCYDGASVMSGHRGGLQALLSVNCGRVVLYIHCFCHKLHLVITDIITDIPAIGDHYSLVKSLKRLLDTRWSGHRDCAHVISSEFMEIIRCLDACCSSRDVQSEHRIIARGLLTQISIPSLLLMNKFLTEFLDVINIASQLCQSKSSNLADALNVIDECKNEISSHTNIYSAKKSEHDLDVLDEQYG